MSNIKVLWMLSLKGLSLIWGKHPTTNKKMQQITSLLPNVCYIYTLYVWLPWSRKRHNMYSTCNNLGGVKLWTIKFIWAYIKCSRHAHTHTCVTSFATHKTKKVATINQYISLSVLYAQILRPSSPFISKMTKFLL